MRPEEAARGRVDPVWALTAVMILCTAAAQALAPPRQDAFGGHYLTGLVVGLLFLASDRLVVHVPYRGQSYSATLSEIPLVLGFALLSAPGLVAVRVLGGGLALAGLACRSRVKYFFNVSLFAFEVTAAHALFWFLAGDAQITSPRAGLAAVTATVLVDLLGSLSVAYAMALHDGKLDLATLRRIMGIQVVAGPTNSAIAIVGLVLARNQPWALLPLCAVIFVIFALYRAYARLDLNYSQLQVLQSFTRSIGSTVETREVVAEVLEQARTLLRARAAELLLLDSEGVPALWARSRRGEELELRSSPLVKQDAWWAPALTGESVLVRARDRSTAGEARDGLAAPMLTSGSRTGVLAVSGRLDSVTTFDANELRLFETLVNHAAVSLQNGRLVDQLRDEVASREHQASHDALTELPNRRHFVQRLEQALLGPTVEATAVLFMDLDGFKEVNDTLGHQIGDELLRLVGSRLLHAVGTSGVVARLGGDEFAVLLPRVAEAADALSVAQLLVGALAKPMKLEGFLLDVGGSVGVALSPEHGTTASVLMRRADIAMYAAKTRGTRAELYDPDEDTHSARRLNLIADLRTALECGELDVVFQPKVDLVTGDVLGAEALARWQHPVFGAVSPDEFIPLAERSGLIRTLTLVVLHKALHACATWPQLENKAPLSVAVNLSMRNLLDLVLPDEVAILLERHGVAAQQLTLEVTESYLMSDVRRSMAVLGRLHALGVRLSIDDFGTGYSSLSQLSRLPVKEVKIDKGFVLGMESDPANAAIVRTTIRLGHELGLQVVAEGCEDLATFEKLQADGADVVQGWYVARPLPEAAFAQWLARWTPPQPRRVIPTRGIVEPRAASSAPFQKLSMPAT